MKAGWEEEEDAVDEEEKNAVPKLAGETTAVVDSEGIAFSLKKDAFERVS